MNVRCSSWAYWKASIVGFPAVSVNWTFFARCCGWGATGENRSKVGDFASVLSVWRNISGRVDRPTMATKFGQNKPKLHWFQFCARNMEIFRINSNVFGVGKFKDGNKKFKGTKGVAIATKFRLKTKNARIAVLYVIWWQFYVYDRVWRLWNSNMLSVSEFFREQKGCHDNQI